MSETGLLGIMVAPSGGEGDESMLQNLPACESSCVGMPPHSFTFSSSNSMSLTIRMQRIFASDWNLVGIARTIRAKLRKNSVLASKSRFACNIAEISTSARSLVLRNFAGGGWPQLLLLLLLIVLLLLLLLLFAVCCVCVCVCVALKLRLIAAVCGDGCTRRIFDISGGLMRAVEAVVVAGDVILWNKPIVGALNSFLNVSAEANNCGSIIKQPTLLAALLAGISAVGFGTFASGGNGNICAGGILVGPIVEIGPKSGLFIGCTGGNCTVGNDGTGNTSEPAVAVTAGGPLQLFVSAATEAATVAGMLLLGAMQLIAVELLGEKAADAAGTETIAVIGK